MSAREASGDTLVYRFVPHAEARNYQLAGWEDRGFAPHHHGCHARVMIWRGEGPPVEPKRSAKGE